MSESIVKYLIFVSYAVEDGQEYAENLKNVLDGIGLPAFVAHKTIPMSSVNPRARMLEAVDQCKYFVVILTPGACRSDFVQKEIDQAIKGAKTIVACKRGDVSRSTIPSGFIQNDVQRLRFDSSESLARQVVYTLTKIELTQLDESRIKCFS